MGSKASSLRNAISHELPLSLVEVLGPEARRYFASGYRDVRHRVSEGPSRQGDEIHAVYAVEYPDDWSREVDDAPRTPHLSTIDAALMTLQGIEAVGLPLGGAAGFWVRSLAMHAGSVAWEDLSSVPVALRTDPQVDASERRALKGNVGNIKVECVLEASDRSGLAAEAAERSTVYRDGYREARTSSLVTAYDPTARVMRSAHRTTGGAANRVYRGIESAWYPGLTVVDSLVTMGQLAQAVILLSRGIDRAGLGTLWMRSIRFTAERPPASQPLDWRIETELIRDQVVARAASGFHDVRVSCKATTGARVEARLAYTE
ncbi:hypothetical protein DY023_06275 [Microbacterium bovistercoris]|uniref:Avirulence D protein (AvrD) n=1 Tax=Microbacterium bovistercoris TaxID=2293570 RepID=A0A371NW51_9MICO|nr:AvrD family protein [Microbacterium bovistercoris]REJ06383.1 hypothetical protein DY023_06275 [Microbacterium bovistercoris]